jgi:tetratricopeptide (TPR) repeat protein
MSTIHKLVVRSVVVGFTACTLALAATPAVAQTGAAPPPAVCKKPRRDAGLISENLYRQLENATDLIAKGKNNEAIEKMQKMVERGSDYEKAVILYNMGFAYSAMNRLNDALKTFEKSLDLHALPIQQEEQLLLNVGQLYVANGQHDEGIRILEKHIAEACSPVPAEPHIMLASAYAEKKRFGDALRQVDLALSKAKEPKEPWLQLKLALHYELKQMKACAETLLLLIGMVPSKPDYWKQLSGIWFDLKNDQDSLAVLAVADRQGFLKTGTEVKNLASIYMLLEIPYKAGTIMQDALDKGLLPADEKNLELLSNAWLDARDNQRAEAALKKLAGVADKGDYYMRLGYIYVDDERWKDAIAALEKANAKGVKKPGDAALLLAKAAYEAGDKRKSAQAAEKALNYEESRKAAADWLGYLRAEAASNEAYAAAKAALEAQKDAAQAEKDAAEARKDAVEAENKARDAVEAARPPAAPALPEPPAPPAAPKPPTR